MQSLSAALVCYILTKSPFIEVKTMKKITRWDHGNGGRNRF